MPTIRVDLIASSSLKSDFSCELTNLLVRRSTAEPSGLISLNQARVNLISRKQPAEAGSGVGMMAS
jgi:hypothetical protein